MLWKEKDKGTIRKCLLGKIKIEVNLGPVGIE